MILGCPACNARFMVADALLSPAGRTVRCGRCSHEWFVERPAVVEQEGPQLSAVDEAVINQIDATLGKAAHAPLPKGSNLPVIQRLPRNPKPFMFAAPALAVVWIILAFFAYFPSWSEAPVLSGIYEAFGATSTDGLVFSDVTMEREEDGGKTRFILSGSISNQTSSVQAVPTVRVSLRNAKDKSIWGREYPGKDTLKAGEVYPFRITNVETMFAADVSSIVVDMGNSLQLLVR